MKVSMKSTHNMAFPYAGRMVEPGAEFTATKQAARLLKANGLAAETELQQEAVPAVTEAVQQEAGPVSAVTTADVEPKPKRAYRRRDMAAE